MRGQRITAVLTLCALLAVGCGSNDEPFGGVNDTERQHAATAFNAQKQISQELLAASRAEADGDITALRTSQQRLEKLVERCENAAYQLDNDRLRSSLLDITTSQSRFLDVFDEYVTALADPAVSAGDTYLVDLQSRMEQAVAQGVPAQRRFLDEMLRTASPETRKVIAEQLRAYDKQLDAASEGR